MKLSPIDRILLLGTCLLAAYQIVDGIDNLSTVPITAYTIAFGILLVAALLLFILGFDALDEPIVVVISTVIPLSLSLGLVWQHLASLRTFYLAFTIIGFLAVVVSRVNSPIERFSNPILTFVHGIAGLIIFLLPIIVVIEKQAAPAFALVGIGGALIGLDGLVFFFLRAGRPITPKDFTYKTLPLLLFITCAAFVIGFKLA